MDGQVVSRDWSLLTRWYSKLRCIQNGYVYLSFSTSCAWSLLLTHSPQQFLDRSAPWLHYVPIQNDLSDLHDALFFFRGDLHGNGAHDDLAKKIAVEGRKWSKAFWRKEDIAAYLFRCVFSLVLFWCVWDC